MFDFLLLYLQLLNLDGLVIGQVYKEYAGWVQEAYTNADNYIIKFPKDLSVAMKAVILAAAIQIVSALKLLVHVYQRLLLIWHVFNF